MLKTFLEHRKTALLDKQVPIVLGKMSSCESIEEMLSCSRDELGQELLAVRKRREKGFTLPQAFNGFPSSPKLDALKQLVLNYYYEGRADFARTSNRLLEMQKTFSESKTQLETLKYSLFGGAVLSAVILGVMHYFSSSLSESSLSGVVKIASAGYLLAFSVLSAFFVSRLELEENSFAPYALALGVSTQLLFFFFSANGF